MTTLNLDQAANRYPEAHVWEGRAGQWRALLVAELDISILRVRLDGDRVGILIKDAVSKASASLLTAITLRLDGRTFDFDEIVPWTSVGQPILMFSYRTTE